ncbi:hypothetical protein ACIRD9_16510 [Streptomyces violaceus]|uniref:hypothetical protein n=1 Tax=Streptomyces violaceus TaxID=1936 RepID=UPI0038306A08
MGERQSNGGLPGRASRHALLDADVEALIVASLVRDGVDAEAEQRAVAAFRAARDAGAHRTRTRRRDDWRSRERRYLGRSLRTTLSVLLASLTLGGVAVAAIGAAGSAADGARDGRDRPPASSSAPRDPAGTPSGDSPGTGSAPTHPDRPAPAQDTEARCRAYQQVEGRGRALDATAWQRLVEAAGGERNVTAYCAEQLSEAKPDGNEGSANKGPAEDNAPPAGNNAPPAGNNAPPAEKNGADKSRSDGKPAQPNSRHR